MHLLGALDDGGGEQHIGRLEVAVDDAVGVAGGQRVGDLGHQQGARDRAERPVLAQVAGQVGAVDEVHHQGQQLALDDQVADLDDVRVGEPQQQRALAQEPHHDIGVGGELLAQDLDRHQLPGRGTGDFDVGADPAAPDGAGGPSSEGLLQQILAPDWPHLSHSSPCRPRGRLLRRCGEPAGPVFPATLTGLVHVFGATGRAFARVGGHPLREDPQGPPAVPPGPPGLPFRAPVDLTLRRPQTWR